MHLDHATRQVHQDRRAGDQPHAAIPELSLRLLGNTLASTANTATMPASKLLWGEALALNEGEGEDAHHVRPEQRCERAMSHPPDVLRECLALGQVVHHLAHDAPPAEGIPHLGVIGVIAARV